jgi:hypothetical protein
LSNLQPVLPIPDFTYNHKRNIAWQYRKKILFTFQKWKWDLRDTCINEYLNTCFNSPDVLEASSTSEGIICVTIWYTRFPKHKIYFYLKGIVADSVKLLILYKHK